MNRDGVRNTTWDELKVGAEAAINRTCTIQDLYLFAHASGNLNPLVLPSGDAPTSGAVAPSMWLASLVSAVLGNVLPGAGTLYRTQTLTFKERVRPGETIRVTVRCIEKFEKPLARFEIAIQKSDGSLVCSGTAEVDVPIETVVTRHEELPTLILDKHDLFASLIARATLLPPLATAVVWPDDHNSLGGALLSADRGLIHPLLIGDEELIRRAAEELHRDLSSCTIVPVADHRGACARAVALVNSGEAGALMKGNVHSDEILAEVVRKDGGLRGHRRISHVFAMDVPTLDHLLFISDAAINIAPDLTAKVDIVQNAVDLARACGVSQPKVGILSAVETVNPAIPSTLDAAVLSKMADRGQIKGALIDGPLAMDNTVDVEATRTKGIASLVAGCADVLIAPNLEAGNMLAKELTFVARAEAAGLVVGAKVPIMLTSRADDKGARLASCALALLYARWKETGMAFVPSATLPTAAE
jgi:phosphotransacetylase/acyl dehydratase